MDFLSQLTSNFSMREGTEVGRTVGEMTSIKGQLVNSRAFDIVIYLRMYLCMALAFIAEV